MGLIKKMLVGGAIIASSLLNSNAQAQDNFGSVDEINNYYDSLRTEAITNYESLPSNIQSFLEDSHQKKLNIYDVMEKDMIRMHNYNENLDSVANDINNIHNYILPDRNNNDSLSTQGNSLSREELYKEFLE